MHPHFHGRLLECEVQERLLGVVHAFCIGSVPSICRRRLKKEDAMVISLDSHLESVHHILSDLLSPPCGYYERLIYVVHIETHFSHHGSIPTVNIPSPGRVLEYNRLGHNTITVVGGICHLG